MNRPAGQALHAAAAADAAPPADGASAEEIFAGYRPLLFAVAYRALGQVGDAEDVLQDAWLRWSAADTAGVRDPRAFLVRTVSRLAIDRLRRIAARRESYLGPWLPAPLATGTDDAAASAERAESLTLAMLVVLESLSPLERVVFVLREAFDFGYAEIADAVGRSEAAVRQLASRARQHVRERRPRYGGDTRISAAAAERFLAVCLGGDLGALMDLLAPEVTLLSDGGGRARAARRPVVGREKVARFLLGIVARRLPSESSLRLMEINGAPGIVLTSARVGDLAVGFDMAAGRIAAIYLVTNPEKLTGVLPAAD